MTLGHRRRSSAPLVSAVRFCLVVCAVVAFTIGSTAAFASAQATSAAPAADDSSPETSAIHAADGPPPEAPAAHTAHGPSPETPAIHAADGPPPEAPAAHTAHGPSPETPTAENVDHASTESQEGSTAGGLSTEAPEVRTTDAGGAAEPSSLPAATSDEAVAVPVTAPRTALGLGVNMLMPGVPLIGAALYSENVALAVESVEGNHALFDFDARTRVLVASARYRLPLAWNDWRPYGDVGFVSVRSDVSGLGVGAQGFSFGAGVERPLDAARRWHLRSEARYVKLMDESHWMVGVGVEWRLALPETTALGRSGGERGTSASSRSGRGVTASDASSVFASGTITKVSLPVSASGRWEFSADLERGTASVYLEGRADGESGAIGFGNATRVSFSGSSLSATFEERDTHEGKPVRAVITVTADERRFSLSITARRSDGLSASASVSGRTSRFEVVPPPEEETAAASEENQ